MYLDFFFVFFIIKVFLFLETLIFIPINFSKSNIVKISFTNGTFVKLTLFTNNDAAKIGKVAFLDPEIVIVPANSFSFNN